MLKRGFKFGDELETGRYKFEQINFKFSQKILISSSYSDGYELEEFSGNMVVKDFSFFIDGYGKRRFERSLPPEVKAIGLSNIKINSFNLDFIYVRPSLSINYARLDSPILDADLIGEVSINQRDSEASIINDVVLTFSSVSRSCNQLINVLESDIRKPLPRDNNGNIVFKFYGRLGNPLIRGVND